MPTNDHVINHRFRVGKPLAQRLRDHGIDVVEVLQRAGLPTGFFEQDRPLATTTELFALWRAIDATAATPGIGLRLPGDERVEHYSPSMVAALCSRSLRDAVQRIARFKRMTCPEEIRLLPTKDEVGVEFVFTEAETPEPDIMVDVCLAWILVIARRGSDGRIAPERLEVRRKTANRAQLEAYFGCPVRFASPRNALIFRAIDMDRPFATRNDDLATVLGAQLESELAAATQGDDEDLTAQVKRALKRSMTGKRPTVEDVAQDLRLSERTLQRRLAAAGVTFQQLAETARRELARQYLRHTPAEFSEVAYFLGYEDPNSFFRAFHHWEGTTPAEWRSRQRAGITTPAG